MYTGIIIGMKNRGKICRGYMGTRIFSPCLIFRLHKAEESRPALQSVCMDGFGFVRIYESMRKIINSGRNYSDPSFVKNERNEATFCTKPSLDLLNRELRCRSATFRKRFTISLFLRVSKPASLHATGGRTGREDLDFFLKNAFYRNCLLNIA